MLATSENIAEFELQFFTPHRRSAASSVQETQHYTIKLIDAAIVHIRFHLPNNRNPELAAYAEFEEIAFTYRKIECIWNDGGVMAEDEWETPVV